MNKNRKNQAAAGPVTTPEEAAEEARRRQQVTAQQALAAEVRRCFAEFTAQGEALSLSFVSHVNTARQIGLLLKEWAGREQLTFEFYRQHQAEFPFSFETANLFVRIANRMPSPAGTLDEARRVMQLDFQAAGLLDLPERGPQTANPIPPLVQLLAAIGNVKERLQKWTEEDPIESWPAHRRHTVRIELRPFVELYEQLDGELD